jgi:hypothetical protein
MYIARHVHRIYIDTVSIYFDQKIVEASGNDGLY